MEVFNQRLEQEYGAEVIVTVPSVISILLKISWYLTNGYLPNKYRSPTKVSEVAYLDFHA